ncbi:hypothetical protein ACFYU8_18000 [Brevibacillus sp. NPDC003359]|uniref:hypothetical protein n=1 Tax=unclassified Brevibacillus TaxID=2684853 RepID=UPI0036AB065C
MSVKYKDEYERYHKIMMWFRSNHDNCLLGLADQFNHSINAIVNAPILSDSEKVEKIQNHTLAYEKVTQELEKMHKEAEWIRNIPIFKDQHASPLTNQLIHIDRVKSELEARWSVDALREI